MNKRTGYVRSVRILIVCLMIVFLCGCQADNVKTTDSLPEGFVGTQESTEEKPRIQDTEKPAHDKVEQKNEKATNSLLEDFIQYKKQSEDTSRRDLHIQSVEKSTSNKAPDKEGQSGDYLYKIKNDQVRITGFADKYATTVDIPSEIEGMPVTCIGSTVFSDMYDLESVTMPDTITNIGFAAFRDCTSLKQVKVSRNLKSISSCIFGGCLSLESIDLSDCKIEALLNHTFYECSSLRSVLLPSTLKSIGQLEFADCASLTDLIIPEGVQKIGDLTFYNTPWYEHLSDEFVVVGDGVLIKYNGPGGQVAIPQNVKYISDAFRNNDDITGISFGSNVVVIGDYAFSNCHALSNIVFPESDCAIGTSAFSGCGMSAVNIPDTVQYISDCAFSDCKNLRHVRLPEKLEYIPYACFSSCSLKNIVLPKGITYIGEYAFSSNWLRTIFIPESVEDIRDNAFKSNTTDLIIRCIEGSAAYDFALENQYVCSIVENGFIETKENEEFEYDCYQEYVNLVKYLGDKRSDQVLLPYELDNKPVNLVEDSLFYRG